MADKLNIYVINLPERNDKWENIVKEFSHPNINLIRVPAIRKQLGWQGLHETNKNIIEKAIEENWDNFVIIEDDCKLKFPIDIFYNKFMIVKKWLDNNPDLWDIYNGGIITEEKNMKLNDNVFFLNRITQNIILKTTFDWTATQFIYYNKKSLKKIYEYQRMIQWDVFLNNFKTVM